MTVDGVECAITRYQEESISCDIQASEQVSAVDVPTVAGPGLRHRFIDGWNRDVSNLDQYNAARENILTHFEA